VPDDKADVFASFRGFITFKNEAFVLCLDEGEGPGNAAEDGAHPTSDDLFESIDEWEFPLVESGVFGHDIDNVGTVAFPQLGCDVADEQLVAGYGKTVLGIEIREVRKQVDELVAQMYVREDLPIAVAFLTLQERSDA
jgi:hypothetical protein